MPAEKFPSDLKHLRSNAAFESALSDLTDAARLADHLMHRDQNAADRKKEFGDFYQHLMQIYQVEFTDVRHKTFDKMFVHWS